MVRIDNVETKKQVKFTPINSSNADNNSIFMDASDNIIKQKDNSGVVKELTKNIIFYKNESYTTSTNITDEIYNQVYSTNIPANTFKKWFKVTFLMTFSTNPTSSTKILKGLRAQLNNNTTREFTTNVVSSASTSSADFMSPIFVFNSSEEDFTADITLDIDCKIGQDDASVNPHWIIIEGI